MAIRSALCRRTNSRTYEAEGEAAGVGVGVAAAEAEALGASEAPPLGTGVAWNVGTTIGG